MCCHIQSQEFILLILIGNKFNKQQQQNEIKFKKKKN